MQGEPGKPANLAVDRCSSGQVVRLLRPEFLYQGTPLMANGVLYVTAGTRRAVVNVRRRSPLVSDFVGGIRNSAGVRRSAFVVFAGIAVATIAASLALIVGRLTGYPDIVKRVIGI